MLNIKEIITLKIEKYNQKGEGVAFFENVPIYVFGTIVGETIEIEIIAVKKKYMIGKIKSIVVASKNRVKHKIKNANKIGGYELIHMNDEEQINFKVNRVKNDFQMIAKYPLTNIETFIGKKRFKYRNKITLHDGFFYEKNSRNKIEIEDFLLSDIQWDRKLKGEIIYRQLDTLIFGNKNSKQYTFDATNGFVFRVGINSFYQVNKEVMDVVYRDIQDFVFDNSTTVDLYAGIGTITIISSKKSKKVIGVEINKNSYNDALFNIQNNQINNIEFFNDNVDLFITKIKQPIDVLILDPSRDGVGKNTMEIINNQIKPKRIIYLSCNPATQAFDFSLIKNNYQITFTKMYDMFPQTYHIENLIVCDLIN